MIQKLLSEYYVLIQLSTILIFFISVKVLCEASCNLSPQFGDQRSPLISAILNQNHEMVQLMLEHNANVNEPCALTGLTPLGFAANDRNLGEYIIQLFLIHDVP